MLNASVRAAAAGLPSAIFNRRRMLLGLAAASTAAASPVAVAASKQPPAELAELMDLGAQTAFALSDYRKAVEAREAIVKAWGPQWPAVPGEISMKARCGEAVKNLEGFTQWNEPRVAKRDALIRVLESWDEPRKWRTGTSEKTKARGELWRVKETSRLKGQIAALDLYEADCARIVAASGIRQAQSNERAAINALVAHVRSVMDLEPTTMTGLLIQAEALEAIGHVPQISRVTWDNVEFRYQEGYGERIAASVLRIASQS